MRPDDRRSARRQLDKRLNTLISSGDFARPPRGWVKAIREALGMTTAQLAHRLGVSQPRAVAIEKAEAKGAITLDSLERAAQALDCRLMYVLVPRQPLETLVEARAQRLASKRLADTRHTMALEAQALDANDEREQHTRLVRQLVDQSGSALWEDET